MQKYERSILKMTIDEFKKDIAPHMNKGYVAMNKDETWTWFNMKPKVDLKTHFWEVSDWSAYWYDLDLTVLEYIEPVRDWTESLIEVGK